MAKHSNLGRDLYQWKEESTYVQKPPFFDAISDDENSNIDNALPLLLLGNSVTPDHISPAGAIKQDSPAGDYFTERQILQKTLTHTVPDEETEVMVRGTFASKLKMNSSLM